MRAKKVQIDHDFQDDGLFAITFYFEEDVVPYYITLSRDELEDPDVIYFEAHDQIHSFKSKEIKYTFKDNIFSLDLTNDVVNFFYWNHKKKIEVIINEGMEDINICLQRIFDLGRKFKI